MEATKLAGAILAAASVVGCAQRAAPVVERSPVAVQAPRGLPSPVSAAATAAPVTVPAGFHMVKRGETLYSIALENGADYRDVARWNGLDDPTKIRVGQLLRVRPPEGESTVQVGAARGTGRPESRPLDAGTVSAQQGRGDGSAKNAPKALRLPYSKENAALVAREEAKAAPQPASIAKPEPGKAEAPRASAPGATEFIWPATGPVLSSFSARSKGVDIGGKVGDPVVAAAPGKVTYVGSGIPGLGKFLIIMHEKDFVTVYAHTSQILVKEQQTVARGQKIAEVGSSDAEKPKLHFQIRKGGSAMDPLPLLPDPS